MTRKLSQIFFAIFNFEKGDIPSLQKITETTSKIVVAMNDGITTNNTDCYKSMPKVLPAIKARGSFQKEEGNTNLH